MKNKGYKTAGELTREDKITVVNYKRRIAELEADVARETARALEAERQCSEHARIGDGYWERAQAAEAPVAELERIAEIEAQLKELAMACNKTLAAALDQARELLADANHIAVCEVDYDETIAPWRERYAAWLAANPAKGNG